MKWLITSTRIALSTKRISIIQVFRRKPTERCGKAEEIIERVSGPGHFAMNRLTKTLISVSSRYPNYRPIEQIVILLFYY